MTEDLYRTAEVVSLTGVTFRQLYHWRERGSITPAAVRRTAAQSPIEPYDADEHRRGSGWTLLWSAETVEGVRAVKALLDEGYRTDRALERVFNGRLKATREGVG